MTAAERQGLRERLEEARAKALGVAYDFHELTEIHESRLDVRKLGKVAQRVLLAAADVRMAATEALDAAKERSRNRCPECRRDAA